MKKKNKNEQIIMEGVAPLKEANFSQEENAEKENFKISEGQISIDDISSGMIDESLVEIKLKEALETEKPKSKKKSLITNLIFLAINILIMVFIVKACLGETKGVPLNEIIKRQGNKLWWLMGGLGLILLMFFADTMMFYFLVKKSTGKKRFGLSCKVSVIGKYYDNITPFAVGGQPSQIMNLARGGVSAGVATSIPVIKLIIYNITYTLIIFLFLVFGMPFLPIESNLVEFFKIFLKFFAVLGLVFTALAGALFMLIGNGKIIGRSAVRWIVRLGYKMHIVKDYRKSYNKVMRQVHEYQSSIDYLKRNKGTLFACIFFGIINVLAYFAIPFTVVMAFSLNSTTSFSMGATLLLVCVVKFMICQMAAVVVPLPGGTGMMEVAFAILFGGSSMLGSYFAFGLLAWRFLTYYYIILQGFIVSTVDNIVRMSRKKKSLKLENEKFE